MTHHTTDQLLTLGMALTTDRKATRSAFKAL